MSIKFYYGSGSPFSWNVWLVLEHKRLPYEFNLLSFQNGELKKPDYLSINPRGKVPALVDDDFALWEAGSGGHR
jgi:glutathione S-transferase